MKKKFILGNVLAHLTSMTLTFDTNINRVRLLSRMNVWTNYEEGRSKRSRVLIGNEMVTEGQTYRQTDNIPTDMCKAICPLRRTDLCKAICPLFFEVGHNN